jgi:hypothetical protein
MLTWKQAALAGAAMLVSGALASLSFVNSSETLPTSTGDIMLLYVGADDCAPCRAWQHGDGAAFRSSTEFARVIYREVKAKALFDVLKDEHWPDDLRSYRDRLERNAGVPLWLIVSDGRVVEQGFGASQWQLAVLPKLRSLLR